MTAKDRQDYPLAVGDTVEVVHGGEVLAGEVRGVVKEHPELARWDVEVAVVVRVPAASTRFLHAPLVECRSERLTPSGESDRPSVAEEERAVAAIAEGGGIGRYGSDGGSFSGIGAF